MILDSLAVGPLAANCYLLGCPRTRAAAAVDPGGDPERILAAIERLELRAERILLTHGHVDHIAAAAAVKRATGARVLVHEADREQVERPHPFWASMVGGVEGCEVDGTLAEGDELVVGDLTVRVLHTPGHTPGCICLAVGDALLTGDTLFAGGIGRTDLPGGSTPVLEDSLRRLVAAIDPQTRIFPGHGPSSTMADEVRANPFLQGL